MKIDIDKIKMNNENPRIIKDNKFKKLVKSIKDFPEMLEKRPLIIDENNVVLGGNMRLKALEHLKYKKVPVIQVTDWNEEMKKEFIIKDNVGFGEWDFDILANEWDIEKLNEWGLDFDFKIEPEAEEDNYEEPGDLKVDVVLGDLIEIGEHRLLCGDSTDSDQVAKLMNGEKADMVFTDPPYLMDFQGGIHSDGSKSYNSKYGTIINDKMSNKDGNNFLDKINIIINTYCNGAFYITFYRLGIDKYYESLKRVGLKSRSLIIWNKGNHTLSNSDYMSKYEPIFYGWVKKHNFYGGKNGVDIWDIKEL